MIQTMILAGSTTSGKDIYTASGSVQTVQENIVSVRNAKIVNLFASQDRAVSEQIGSEKETDVIDVDTTTESCKALAQYLAQEEEVGEELRKGEEEVEVVRKVEVKVVVEKEVEKEAVEKVAVVL